MNTGVNNKILSEFKNYHFPDLSQIVKEKDKLSFNSGETNYEKPITALERALFLTDVAQILIQHKNQEKSIIVLIQDIIKYMITSLNELNNADAQCSTPQLLHFLVSDDQMLGVHLIKLLPEILLCKYPNFSTSPINSGDMDYIEWCLHHMLAISEKDQNLLRNTLSTREWTLMPSIQVLCHIMQQLFLSQTHCPEYKDHEFNLFFNQAIFWTTVLKMFQECIRQDMVGDHIQCVIALLKNEVRQFFLWYDINKIHFKPMAMVKYLEHLVNSITYESSDILLFQARLLLSHCKLILQKAQ